MGGLLIGLGIIAVVYLIIGCLLAFLESSQTDDPFNWKILLKWPWMLFGKRYM